MLDNNIVYFDNAATTRIDPEILKTYNEVCQSYFANTSSIHALGTRSFALLEKARKQISDVLSLLDHEVIFTSGATEANNLVIKGVALTFSNRGKHMIVSEIEHPSVLEAAKQLEEQFGFDITYLSINKEGKVDINELKKAIRKDTILVSIMAVNNEIGSINNIEEIGRLLKEYPKIYFHVDTTQAIGKIDISYKDADFITYSGHKIHSVKNSGALIKRKNIILKPLASGGGQEKDQRSGTVDLAGASSLAKATRIAISNQKANFAKIRQISQQILAYLKENPSLYHINSSEENPYIINFSTLTKKASVVVEALSNRNIMVSSTSACHSRKEIGSYVVFALTKEEKISSNTVRISLSSENSVEDANKLIKALDEIIKEVKNK